MARGFDLEPGETVVDTWTAGIPHKKGKKVKWGGTLRLTDRRVIWEVVKLSSKQMFSLGPMGVVVGAAAAVPLAVANRTIGATLGDKRGLSIPLDAITAVGPEEGAHAVLVVETAEGEMRLLVTASKWSYNKVKDQQARDAAIEAIDAARAA
jgi:hypothetical protein